MPDIRIPASQLHLIRLALNTYGKEVNEIISAIEVEAKFAGLPAKGYVPPVLDKERELLGQCHGIIESFTEDTAQLFGRHFLDDHLRVIHSALILRRDDLRTRLHEVEANKLSPREAMSPLNHQISLIDAEIDRFWSKFGVSTALPTVQSRRALKAGLVYPDYRALDGLIADGEGQEVEFVEQYPKQAHDIAKEIAAFATSNPGTILLGVTDDGGIQGLDCMDELAQRDKLRTRIEGVCSNSVTPSVLAAVTFEVIERKTVVRIAVPKGPQPVYFSNNIPYIRHGSLSRPAQAQEVTEQVRRFLAQQAG